MCVCVCRFLGKVLSQYISVCVAEGRGNSDLISTGFNYDRWKKTYNKAKPVRYLWNLFLNIPEMFGSSL